MSNQANNQDDIGFGDVLFDLPGPWKPQGENTTIEKLLTTQIPRQDVDVISEEKLRAAFSLEPGKFEDHLGVLPPATKPTITSRNGPIPKSRTLIHTSNSKPQIVPIVGGGLKIKIMNAGDAGDSSSTSSKRKSSDSKSTAKRRKKKTR